MQYSLSLTGTHLGWQYYSTWYTCPCIKENWFAAFLSECSADTIYCLSPLSLSHSHTISLALIKIWRWEEPHICYPRNNPDFLTLKAFNLLEFILTVTLLSYIFFRGKFVTKDSIVHSCFHPDHYYMGLIAQLCRLCPYDLPVPSLLCGLLNSPSLLSTELHCWIQPVTASILPCRLAVHTVASTAL